MNISMSNSPFSVLSQRYGGGLKSTQEKVERQQKMRSQVDFFENQKAGLKNMHCSTLEEIARKLEMFQSYEDQIAAAKIEYNREQMMHCLDEAKEQGDKIAEAVEKMKPKTAEERREEMVEEALGTEDEGMLTEMLDELDELDEMTEELEEMKEVETLQEPLDELLAEELAEPLQESAQELEGMETVDTPEKTQGLDEHYVPIDIKA